MFVGDAIARFRTGAHYNKFLGTRVRQEMGWRFLRIRRTLSHDGGAREHVLPRWIGRRESLSAGRWVSMHGLE